MVESPLIKRYNIIGTYDRISRMDDLFSGSENDPVMAAESDAFCITDHPTAISVAIGSNHTCITQIIVFGSRRGYDKYMSDGITFYMDKEL